VSSDTREDGVLEYFTLAIRARAASYRDKAAQLREMGEPEPIRSLRYKLLDLSRHFEELANRSARSGASPKFGNRRESSDP